MYFVWRPCCHCPTCAGFPTRYPLRRHRLNLPILGNHDWRSTNCLFGECQGAYLDYFTLPGNEHYYDFIWGPVHIFILDSAGQEPDGIATDSHQAHWLQTQLQASQSPWKLVFLHHPPYSSSSTHGSTPELQWPFKEWRASAVFLEHDHIYERLHVDSLPYFINRQGGKRKYGFADPLPDSQFRFSDDFGAMLVEADTAQNTFRFVSRAGMLVDIFILDAPITQ